VVDDRTRSLWIGIRQALLLLLDAVERYLDLCPRTSELRKQAKEMYYVEHNAT